MYSKTKNGSVSLRESLFSRFKNTLTAKEFLDFACRLTKVDRSWLVDECVNYESDKRWFGLAADELAISLGYTSSDQHAAWMKFLKQPSRDIVEEELTTLSENECRRVISLSLDKYRETGSEYFLELADWTAFYLGQPDTEETDWGPYREGENGPGND